jgi:hypothetical protein
MEFTKKECLRARVTDELQRDAKIGSVHVIFLQEGVGDAQPAERNVNIRPKEWHLCRLPAAHPACPPSTTSWAPDHKRGIELNGLDKMGFPAEITKRGRNEEINEQRVFFDGWKAVGESAIKAEDRREWTNKGGEMWGGRDPRSGPKVEPGRQGKMIIRVEGTAHAWPLGTM